MDAPVPSFTASIKLRLISQRLWPSPSSLCTCVRVLARFCVELVLSDFFNFLT